MLIWSIQRGRRPAAPGGSHKPTVAPGKAKLIDGVWTWFTDPRGLYYNGNVYAGDISRNGSILAVRWPDGGGVDQSFVLHHKMEQDDHDNPSFLVRASDQRLLAFYSRHSGAELYLRISSNPEDVSAWAAETDLAASLGGTVYTYSNPVQLTGEANDPIYLFYRDTVGGVPAGHHITFSSSIDGGATWAAQTALINATYAKLAANGDARIDMVIGNNPVNALDHGIYHLYYQGGNYYESDGTQIVAGTPFAVGDLTQVYDGSVTNAWLWDIAVDGSGYPVITYATFSDINDHLYRYARWNGSSWDNYDVVASGGSVEESGAEPYYSGGIVLDHDDVNTVYLSREVNSVHEIWKYVTANGGSSWSGVAITSGNKPFRKQFRPVVIRDHSSDTLLWLSGKYYEYTDYRTDVVRQ